MTEQVVQALGLFVAIVVTAAAVNRFAPTARPRLRAIAILFVLYVMGLGAARLLRVLDQAEWAGRVQIATEIVRVVTIITLAGTIVFRILLRRIGVALPTIAGDLILGVGYIVATIGVLSQHGLDPTGALATGAVVSAVLAISLQTTLGNILGGVALQLDGSIHEGDWIQLENGKQGRVRAIRWRHTLVETRDWSTIVVPNAQLLRRASAFRGSEFLSLGGGDEGGSAACTPGDEGHFDATFANGGIGCVAFGYTVGVGGNGGALNSEATAGQSIDIGSNQGHALAGSGGGGVGRIRINTAGGTGLRGTGIFSPNPTQGALATR